MGLGRYIPRIARIAAQTDLNIIVATGIYTYYDLPHVFAFRGPGTVFGGPEIDRRYVRPRYCRRHCRHDIKAGILKCCTDEPGLTPASNES